MSSGRPVARGRYQLRSVLHRQSQEAGVSVISKQDYYLLTEGQRARWLGSLRDLGLGASSAAFAGLISVLATRDAATPGWTTGEVVAVAFLASLVLLGLGLVVVWLIDWRASAKSSAAHAECVERVRGELGIERSEEPSGDSELPARASPVAFE